MVPNLFDCGVSRPQMWITKHTGLLPQKTPLSQKDSIPWSVRRLPSPSMGSPTLFCALHMTSETSHLQVSAHPRHGFPSAWESPLSSRLFRKHSHCGSFAVFKSVCLRALSRNFISSLDLNGIDLTPVQDTPVASRKEDTYVHFNVDIELQKHVEKLTKGLWC